MSKRNGSGWAGWIAMFGGIGAALISAGIFRALEDVGAFGPHARLISATALLVCAFGAFILFSSVIYAIASRR